MKLKIYKRGLSNFTIEMISHTAPRYEAIKTLFVSPSWNHNVATGVISMPKVVFDMKSSELG